LIFICNVKRIIGINMSKKCPSILPHLAGKVLINFRERLAESFFQIIESPI